MTGVSGRRPGRRTGYAQLEGAVGAFAFYDEQGRVTADNYRP